MSIAPDRKTNSYTMETNAGDAMLDIPNNQTVNNNTSVISEWDDCIRGKMNTKDYKRQRLIQKVPPLLLEGEKGRKNSECYEPAVVSLGPYHHKQARFAQAETYKLITLEEYRLSTGETYESLCNKVFEVVHDAKKCYIIDGYAYDDEEFNLMMLRDGCFILFFIECISHGNNTLMLNNEYLGAIGFANIMRDIFLLENQIPFVVLEVLLTLRFPDDKGEDILNGFFNYIKYGEVVTRKEKVLGNKRPLHLLELYRSYFISLSASVALDLPKTSIMGRRRSIEKDAVGDYNYVKRNRSFGSVTELKAKGIFLKCTHDESTNEGIRFQSRHCYGKLVVVRRAVSPNTKAIYLNMIAYEMCPHNPNDFRISTYLRAMKSLIVQRDDVKELRTNGILLHSLGRDEDVVKMYEEIEVPAVNLYMFDQLREKIEKHCNSKYKTWLAELFNVYFNGPWEMLAMLVGTAILFTTILQTYFTIRPLPDDTNAS